MDHSTKLHPDPGPDGEKAAREAVLVARARQGDQSAWTALVSDHQEPVFRLAYLMLGRMQDTAAQAEDVAQEAFIRAYLNLDRFEDGRPLRPWLLAIAANLARNRRRSLGRYWTALRRWMRAERTESALDSHGRDEHQDDQHVLWGAIERLSTGHQQALYLRYFLDMAEDEMAQALDVAPGTVKSRLHRARQALKTVLEEEYPHLYEQWQGN